MSNWTIRRVEGASRLVTAAFMKNEFLSHFGATVTDDTDELFAIISADGSLEGAFGLNHHAPTFFCRHYLSDLDNTVRELQGHHTNNVRIVELAHLCIRHPATLCRIVSQLARFLRERSDYLICTVTASLARFFERKGLTSRVLGAARIEQLPATKQTGWGSYYQHQPEVLLGSLQDACERLATLQRHQPGVPAHV